jgi:hypothetical protein
VHEGISGMNGNKDNANSSNSVAVLALLTLIPLFIFVISNGWQSILAPFINLSENNIINLAATWTAAVAIAIVSVVLAWGVASERARLRNEKTARFTWLAYLGVLIVLSALGTMNWLFKVLEAPTFLKEATEETQVKLTALEQLALNGIKLVKTDELRTRQEEQRRNLQMNREQLESYFESAKLKASAGPERFKKEIISLFDGFESEVRNPLKEGCGEVARGYLQEILTKLPDLRLPSGDCSKADPDVMIKAYRAAVDKALVNWANSNEVPCDVSGAWDTDILKVEAITGVDIPTGGTSCSEVERTLRSIERSIETYISDMPPFAPGDEALAQLRQSSAEALRSQIDKVKALYLDASKMERDTASPILKTAWSEYSTVYTKLQTAVDPTEIAKLPPSIDDARIDKIGHVGNTIEILSSRYNHISTYPIVLAAILFDIILVAFFFRVEISRTQKRQVGGHAERLRKIRSSLNEA